MTNPITKEAVLAALSKVQEPELHQDLVTLNMIRELDIQGDKVSFTVMLTTPACPLRGQIEKEARQAVMSLGGVKEVVIKMDSDVPNDGRMRGLVNMPIRNAIAVGSGKGGVGKSTVSVNLAVALAQAGARVGLMDADIYGPNIPTMLGVEKLPPPQGQKLIPAQAYGIKMISMGLLVKPGQPLIWRGPMAHKALQQCLFEVEWGELDYLICDLPPGTGDVHLTLVQSVPVTGAVIVSTPQDVGLTISMKTLRMFQQTNVPVLGIIENMSYHICSHCGAREEIFGHGGARSASESLGVPFFGEIPIDVKIRRHADSGTPIVLAEPESPSANAYREILEQLAAQVSIRNYRTTPLKIVEIPV